MDHPPPKKKKKKKAEEERREERMVVELLSQTPFVINRARPRLSAKTTTKEPPVPLPLAALDCIAY